MEARLADSRILKAAVGPLARWPTRGRSFVVPGICLEVESLEYTADIDCEMVLS